MNKCEIFADAYFTDRCTIPRKTTVLSVAERFKTKGCDDVRHDNTSRTKTVLTEENKEIVCAAVEVNPKVSPREMSSEINVSKNSRHRALQRERY